MRRFGVEQAHDVPLLPQVGHRDLDRAVQPELAVADLLQQADGRLQNVVGGQHAVAEAPAAALDPLGGGDLFLAVEHGNLAHLHQVDPHRVVDLVVAAGRLAVCLLIAEVFVESFALGIVGRRAAIDGRLALAGRRGPIQVFQLAVQIEGVVDPLAALMAIQCRWALPVAAGLGLDFPRQGLGKRSFPTIVLAVGFGQRAILDR